MGCVGCMGKAATGGKTMAEEDELIKGFIGGCFSVVMVISNWWHSARSEHRRHAMHR